MSKNQENRGLNENLNSPSNTRLTQGLKEGDIKAFEVVYNIYSPELYRHARRVILIKEDCEEIIHDVFAYLWEKRETTTIISLRAYLYKAVGNRVADYLKKNYVHRRYLEHFQLFESIYDNNDDAETVQQLIEAGLKDLPDRVQMAVRLRLSENISNVEIAKRMQLSLKTIENYMHQAYSHFRHNWKYIARINS